MAKVPFAQKKPPPLRNIELNILHTKPEKRRAKALCVYKQTQLDPFFYTSPVTGHRKREKKLCCGVLECWK